MKLIFDEYNPPGGEKDSELSPVILLHGRLDSRRTWKKLAPKIAEKTGRTPERVEKLFVEDMVVDKYSPKSTNVVLQIINFLRKSLTAIPEGADEMTAKTAVVNFMKKILPPGSTTGFVYEAESLPLKRVGREYTWQANLDVLEDMLKNRQAQEFVGAYEGPALFLYGNKSFFDV